MLSTELEQGGSYTFKIVKEKSQSRFFIVKTDDGEEHKILKFKFQQKQPVPDEIQCYVKSQYPLNLSQDISVHISNFYDEGEEYSFVVKDQLREDSSQYELSDHRGLCFKLANSPVPLSKGTRVRCKVLKIKDAYVNLKYIGSLGSKFSLEFHTIEQWLHLLNIKQYHAGYYKKLLDSIPELQPALLKYENRVPGWTLDLLQICTQHITEWLVACRDDLKKLRKICERLELGRKLALYMVQESDFLRACGNEHRHMLQSQLSTYVELFENYREAASMILEKTHVEYIDRMFSRLKNSGYLYMPSTQIRIMMTILKLRPELINARMGELFEALHNWDISNWEAEPFREALVQQLQLFIEENADKINNLPANDSSQDSKVIVRMILAIAIQRILANETDNIDLNLNRARLYRYISYLYPSEVNNLLEKGICSLLGIEWPNEYSWADTENPTLLFVKSSHPLPQDDERTMITKTYTTSKAELILSSDKLHLIGNDAESDTTVLPNNMFDWLNPVISIVDTVNFPQAKKAKDLKTLSQVWKEISWSLFGGNESTVERIEKRFPDDGDETMVIIDDIRILDSGNEKQRLQFHCTIHDESLFGEGWMPSDALHMIGWLSQADIPGNYDGSLKFATDSDGEPLLFPATVHIRHDGTLEFSMKRQIEEHLKETSFPGKESVAIVTYLDKINNVWLCLSETGATYKVPFDDTTESLTTGKLVRVKYIEQDYSITTSQFFIGELSENQENLPLLIKKSECLFNLMQGLGIKNDDELPYQVRESGEVMSKEELEELIYILQRRAFSETEYIKAYNFLGLATLLCRLAENKNLEKEISVHMKLLEFLQEFSRNRRLDYDMVEAFDTQVKNSPMLERLYTRIKIVSYIDSNQNTPGLWEIRQNPRNETEGKLAALVLSYNMLPSELEDPKKQILNEISTLLNINNAIATAKYYGDESQTIEFKSSLIFSSKSGSRPDPKGQLHELTHTICGFMNARGGKLFIGVNDSGYENGLDDDLTYRRNRGEKATIDALIVELQNHLDRTMPPHAKDHWEIASDPESKKGVIIVDVKPVRQPVELNGVIYVRASSTTKPRLGEEREEFIKSREHNYNILMALWGIHNSSMQSDEPAVDSEESAESASTSESKPKAAVESQSDINMNVPDEIATGKYRQNVLHDYEENFVTPLFYIYFRPNDSFYTSSEDLYVESESRLALAVKDYEQESYIVYTLEDGNVGKIRMKEVASALPKSEKKIDTEKSLSVVNIAEDKDYLLSVLKAPNKSLYYRLDKIDKIPEGTTTNETSQPICTLQHKLVRQEIVKPEKVIFFDKDAINKDNNLYGVSVPVGDGTLSEDERINDLLKPVVIV